MLLRHDVKMVTDAKGTARSKLRAAAAVPPPGPSLVGMASQGTKSLPREKTQERNGPIRRIRYCRVEGEGKEEEVSLLGRRGSGLRSWWVGLPDNAGTGGCRYD